MSLQSHRCEEHIVADPARPGFGLCDICRREHRQCQGIGKKHDICSICNTKIDRDENVCEGNHTPGNWELTDRLLFDLPVSSSGDTTDR